MASAPCLQHGSFLHVQLRLFEPHFGIFAQAHRNGRWLLPCQPWLGAKHPIPNWLSAECSWSSFPFRLKQHIHSTNLEGRLWTGLLPIMLLYPSCGSLGKTWYQAFGRILWDQRRQRVTASCSPQKAICRWSWPKIEGHLMDSSCGCITWVTGKETNLKPEAYRYPLEARHSTPSLEHGHWCHCHPQRMVESSARRIANETQAHTPILAERTPGMWPKSRVALI